MAESPYFSDSAEWCELKTDSHVLPWIIDRPALTIQCSEMPAFGQSKVIRHPENL